MQFIDLNTQTQRIEEGLLRRIKKVMDRGNFILGEEVYTLEALLAEFVGVEYALTVASGTDALLMALMALEITPGDEVITTPFSFFAAAEVIALLGAIPVFVDIDPNTFNIDPAKIEAAITSKTKVMMPVNLFGQCADYDAIHAIAAAYRLPIIEDAAQSFGALYKGRRSCSLATIACTSFFPSKPLGCFGDGGGLFYSGSDLG